MSRVNLVELRDVKRIARERLAKAYADSLFDDDELERRLEAVEDAEDPDTVRTLYRDVVPPGEDLMASVSPPVTALATVDDGPLETSVAAILGETKRTGAWAPGRRNRVRTILGSTQLDFREARLPPGTTEIRLQVVAGEVTILVPPGLAVQTQCTVVLGEVDLDEEVSAAPAPGGPQLLLTGYVVVGEVDVYERLPGESRRDAKRRRKAERKRRKRERRKALKSG